MRANVEYQRHVADIEAVLGWLDIDDGYRSGDGGSGGVEEEDEIGQRMAASTVETYEKRTRGLRWATKKKRRSR